MGAFTNLTNCVPNSNKINTDPLPPYQCCHNDTQCGSSTVLSSYQPFRKESKGKVQLFLAPSEWNLDLGHSQWRLSTVKHVRGATCFTGKTRSWPLSVAHFKSLADTQYKIATLCSPIAPAPLHSHVLLSTGDFHRAPQGEVYRV